MTHYKGAASEAGRAINLLKKRQKEQEEIEVRKKKIEDELKIGNIQNKFATHYDAVEQQLKSDTIGLVTLDQMRARQEDVIRKRESQLAKKDAAAKLEQKKARDKKQADKLKIASLSFDPEDDDDEEDGNSEGDEVAEEEEDSEEDVPKKRKRFGKNPEVDTSFLPDRDREEAENKLREALRGEWAMNQELMKNEEISITYSYWDGSGHRRQITMRKGNSIQQFLEALRGEWAMNQELMKNEEISITYSYWDGSGHRRQITMRKGNSIQQFLQPGEALRGEWAMNQELMKNEEIFITYSYWDGSGHRRQITMRKGNSIQQFLEALRGEWAMNQELMKNEEISITYSYWDGSGHRRQITMRKGNSIQQFLQKCLENLRKEFNDLKTVSVDQLMFVKEDLILPQHYTFYDFLVTKARGKSGALFSFEVYEDVRITNDHRISKDESHAGKICMRQWYERNKHIFPASRWEPYDPEKKWDHYTVSDKNAAKITVK